VGYVTQSGDIPTRSGEMLLADIAPRQHVVQLYRPGGKVLVRSVGRYLSEGLGRGDVCLVVATEAHLAEFFQQLSNLGLDPSGMQEQGRLVALDGRKTLAGFMIDGQPSARLFDQSVGRIVRELRDRTPNGMLRAYGEMVGVLWLNGQFSAAMALEELWNDLLRDASFSLFCSYPIDVFHKSFHRCDVDAVMCSHTHMVPEGMEGDLESAVLRAMDESFGADNKDWKSRFERAEQPPWAASLKGEALILWIRENLPRSAEAILVRAKSYLDTPSLTAYKSSPSC
jgi:hypothetical protein